MTTIEHLKDAPIVEAVIEIKSRQSNNVKENISEFYNIIKAKYPNKSKELINKIRFDFKSKNEISVTRDEGNTRFESLDKKQILIVHNSGFRFSRLKPYTSWETILLEIQEIIDFFKKHFKHDVVERLGVRNINKIYVDPDRYDELLNFKPNIKGIEENKIGVHNAMQRFVLGNLQIEAKAIVNHIISPVRREDKVLLEVVFDIDTVKDVSTPYEWGRIEKYLTQLRDFKNHLFFNNITDTLKETFK